MLIGHSYTFPVKYLITSFDLFKMGLLFLLLSYRSSLLTAVFSFMTILSVYNLPICFLNSHLMSKSLKV